MSTIAGETQRESHIAISVEALATIAVVVIALVLRGIDLGNPPLSNSEATQALAALQMTSEGQDTGVIQSPTLFGAMVLSFAIAGPTDASARALPLIAGVLLISIPLLLRHRIGRGPALIASFLLAISPIAVAASRQVDPTGTALLALLLAAVAMDRYLIDQKPITLTMSGIASGFALTSDVVVMVPLLSLLGGVAYAILTDDEQSIDRSLITDLSQNIASRRFIIPLVATTILLGTLFFLAPHGLGAIGDELARFATGFLRRDAGSPWTGIVLVGYAGGLLIFGVVGGWMASQSADPWWRGIAGWATLATILVLAYPGAQPLSVLWAIVPLSLLAGAAITQLLTTDASEPEWPVWALGALTITLTGGILAYVSHHLIKPSWYPLRLGNSPDPAFNFALDLLIALLLFGILVVLWLTVASFWGRRTAIRGLGIGLAALMLMLTLGRSGSIAFASADNPYEMIRREPAQRGLSLLAETAQNVSTLAVGEPESATITAQVSPDGVVAWALRDFPNIEFVQEVDPSVSTDLVVTTADSVNPALGSAYVGQDFVVTQEWQREELPFEEWVQWFIYHHADSPMTESRVILWVREDIYLLSPEGGILP